MTGERCGKERRGKDEGVTARTVNRQRTFGTVKETNITEKEGRADRKIA